jgi:amidophosphoribosyltransferase
VNCRESCGLFGIYSHGEEVARLTFFALFALQHRGQESSGIATSDGKRIYLHAGIGLVSHVFNEDNLNRLPGFIAIGHNRYSTTGSSRSANAQPIKVRNAIGEIALGHNGNIINVAILIPRLLPI